MIIANNREPNNQNFQRLHFLRDPRGWIGIELTTSLEAAREATALSVETLEHFGVRRAILRNAAEGAR